MQKNHKNAAPISDKNAILSQILCVRNGENSCKFKLKFDLLNSKNNKFQVNVGECKRVEFGYKIAPKNKNLISSKKLKFNTTKQENFTQNHLKFKQKVA